MIEQDTPKQPKVIDLEQLEQELKNINFSTYPKGMTLNPQELYLLQQAGYEPINVVFGSIVYSMGLQGILKSFRRALKRGEMSDFTKINQDARELARNRMLEKAMSLGATHVVSVGLHVNEWADFVEIVATGTAVKRVRDAQSLPIAVS